MSGHRKAKRRAWVTRREKMTATDVQGTVTRLLGGRLACKRLRRVRRLYGSPLAINPHPYWAQYMGMKWSRDEDSTIIYRDSSGNGRHLRSMP